MSCSTSGAVRAGSGTTRSSNSIVPARRRQVGSSRARASGGGVQDVAEPLDRNLHLLEILPELRQAQDRLRDLAAIMLKATSSPTVSSPSMTALAPKTAAAPSSTLLTYWIAFCPWRRASTASERGPHVGGEPLLPLVAQHRLDGGGLDRLHADDGFDEELLALRAAVELLVDLVAQQRPDQRGDERGRAGSWPARSASASRNRRTGRDEDEGEQQVERREQALSRQEAADGLQLAHARDRLARSGASRNRRPADRIR